jgi:heparan-alpha-glucosaminide N-acetyltransferase
MCFYADIHSTDYEILLQGLIAGILCNFSKNDGIIPVNKNLWSLSFVLGLASMAFLLQSFIYLIVDAKHWWSGSPFYYAGKCSGKHY